MIYLFHGSDSKKVRSQAFAWVAAARAKAPDAFYVRLNTETITREALNEAVSAQGLFFNKTLALLDDPFADAETAELVLESLEILASSNNAIAIVAPKLLPARAKKIEAHAAKVFRHDAVPKPARGFNSGLVNALGSRDGKILWKEIQKAYRQGDAPEMIHGLLHWKARDLMTKKSRDWSPDQARMLSRELIQLVSDSRGKDIELSLALERFALSI